MKGRAFNNLIPAFLWMGYHLAVFGSVWSFIQCLMLLRAGVVFYFFLVRDEPSKRAPVFQIVVAWVSTFVPALMKWDAAPSMGSLIGELIAIAGTAFFVLSCIDLGKSFGVSPALRTPVFGGVYRFVSHPLYLSHALVEIGILIASPTRWNFAVVTVAWSLYSLRAFWESRLILASKPCLPVTAGRVFCS
jgi:hypothetical protein